MKTGVAASVGAPALVEAGQAAKDAPVASPRPAPSRERLLLDFGWRFQLGHADDPERDFGFGRGSEFSKSGGMLIPSRLNFDDSQWQAIDLPHDWAVALPFEKPANNSVTQHGSKPLGRLFPATSIGWYRKLFDLPASDLGRRFWLEFDGVYRDAMVVFNGHFIGRHMSGYAPFRYDVTDFVNYGAKNVLVVRVDATQNDGWFYEGAGIYRHVWLVKTHPVHVAHGGTFVTSEVRPGAAVLAIATEVENRGDKNQAGRVVSTVLDPAGKAVASATAAPAAIAPWRGHEFKQQLTVAKPALWSLETPNLYRLLTKVEVGGAVVDQYETPFGIRTIRFDADQGFFLNGKPVRILGTCNHQDHAGVGSALPDRIQDYRIQKLKEMGWNAYRTSHNPPTAELLDACDRLGMLVMDETRTMDSHPQALEELEALVRRDRNHPSVFLWSLGNEEREQGSERGARIVATMKRLVRRLDPSRPVTVAQNGGYAGVGVSTVVDVMGFNYNEPAIDGYRQKNPKQPLIGSRNRQHRVHARHLRQRQGKGLRQRLRPQRPALGLHGREVVEVLRRAPVPGRRLRLDRLRLSRRARRPTAGPASTPTSASWTSADFPRTFTTTTRPGGAASRCCTCSRTGTGPRAGKSTSGATPISTASSCSSTARAWGPRTSRATPTWNGKCHTRPACSKP